MDQSNNIPYGPKNRVIWFIKLKPVFLLFERIILYYLYIKMFQQKQNDDPSS